MGISRLALLSVIVSLGSFSAHADDASAETISSDVCSTLVTVSSTRWESIRSEIVADQRIDARRAALLAFVSSLTEADRKILDLYHWGKVGQGVVGELLRQRLRSSGANRMLRVSQSDGVAREMAASLSFVESPGYNLIDLKIGPPGSNDEADFISLSLSSPEFVDADHANEAVDGFIAARVGSVSGAGFAIGSKADFLRYVDRIPTQCLVSQNIISQSDLDQASGHTLLYVLTHHDDDGADADSGR
ncbi:MAG TPA: hypothetical protein VL588_04155 [Bdellovibrionota bacterium]|jgi:hypothetical protein|nr:hypothetical protein [Bdellovibrionota bacterium]